MSKSNNKMKNVSYETNLNKNKLAAAKYCFLVYNFRLYFEW